jgi:hypothetical protein
MRPPQEHIDAALEAERNVPNSDQKLYLECMNQKPMSQRTTDRELRDGCILTGVYRRCKPEIDVLDEEMNYIE